MGWARRPAGGVLAVGQIHLWALEMAAVRHSARLKLLTPAEWARAERLRTPRRREQYLGGRVGLRILLGAYTGLAGHALRFGYGSRGKPRLLNPLPDGELCFNYTLSGGWALYACAWNRRLGIDLEVWPRHINARLLAKRKLAPPEQRAWRAVAAAQRERAMLACWTRKEAFGKALGVGIHYPMRTAPMFVDLTCPVWQCAAGAGWGGAVAGDDVPAPLHGVQLATPFPGIAALMYDQDALPLAHGLDAVGAMLQGWRLQLD